MRIFCSIFVLLFFSSCHEQQTKAAENAVKSQQEVRVEFNPNIETVGIILGLSDLGDYVLENFSGYDYTLVYLYRKEFEAFKQHPAVLKANELGNLNLLHFNHYYYGLSFTTLPEFKLNHSQLEEFYHHDHLTKVEVETELQAFNEGIKQFYMDANVEAFFTQNKAFYDKIATEIKTSIPSDIISTMEGYFGSYANDYVICPSPAIMAGFNFGPSLTLGNKKVFYYLTGPAYDLKPTRTSLKDITATDSLGFDDNEYITELAIHEFGHSFVRFLDKEEHKAQIETLSQLNTDELKENLEKIGEGTAWSTGFEEHLVRATEIMVWKKLGKEKRAEQKLKDEYKKEGLLYIAAFVHSLEKYESKREQYPTLESYFTVLIRDLTALMNN